MSSNSNFQSSPFEGDKRGSSPFEGDKRGSSLPLKGVGGSWSFPEAEQAMLWILTQPGINLAEWLNGPLTEEAFYDPINRQIFACLRSAYEGGNEHPTVFDLALEAQRLGNPDVVASISLLIQNDLTTRPPSVIAHVLLQYQWRRETYTLCHQLLQQLDNPAAPVEELIGAASVTLANMVTAVESDFSTLDDAAADVVRQAIDNLDPEHRHSGVSTGFRQIDETGGLPEVGVTVIAADTSQGKSALGIDLALQNLRQGDKVAYYSLEMPRQDMARRILSAATGLPFHQLAYQPLTPEEMERLTQAQQQLLLSGEGARMFFDDRMPDGIRGIVQSIRQLADPRGKGVRHFYVDYMQILTWAESGQQLRQMSVEQFLAHTARTFHNLSLQLGVQIVLLSQVNRDGEYRELTLDRIRDSKQIADAATSVLLLYRPEAYHADIQYQSPEFRHVSTHGTALLNLAKRRNGPTVKCIVGFDAPTTHFYPLQQLPLVETPQDLPRINFPV